MSINIPLVVNTEHALPFLAREENHLVYVVEVIF